ncbi:Polyphosphatidylinositol phosphatase INP53 [Diplonema papillatum]|nr:Polyphosphatidylinositol phosphatase INP53 [Diplonema papillatum]|eukprot:gene9441-14641_t
MGAGASSEASAVPKKGCAADNVSATPEKEEQPPTPTPATADTDDEDSGEVAEATVDGVPRHGGKDEEESEAIAGLSLEETLRLAAERDEEASSRLLSATADARPHAVPLMPLDKDKNVLQHRDWKPGSELRIWTGTWNMEGHGVPDDASMQTLVQKDQHHVYAIGTQECLRTIQQSFINSDKDMWERGLQNALGDRYVMLTSATLVAIHVAVFVRQDIMRFIHSDTIEQAKVATGALRGTMGNKGGVGVSFVIGPADSTHSISLLFLSGHFAAHQNAVADRNKDYANVTRLMKLGTLGRSIYRPIVPDFNTSGGSPAMAPTSPSTVTSPTTSIGASRDVTNEFDLVFFMGDFNYRINGTRPAVEAMLASSHEGALEALLHNDQLSREIRHGRVFHNFREAHVDFNPTYKFAPGADVYETKKNRIPSWTDRILFKQHPSMLVKRHFSTESLCIRPTTYTSIQAMRHSDHRPVIATFVLKTPLPEATAASVVTVGGPQESSACSVM